MQQLEPLKIPRIVFRTGVTLQCFQSLGYTPLFKDSLVKGSVKSLILILVQNHAGATVLSASYLVYVLSVIVNMSKQLMILLNCKCSPTCKQACKAL